MKRILLLSMGCAGLLTAITLGWAEDEKPERPVVKPREEVRKEEVRKEEVARKVVKEKPKSAEQREAELSKKKPNPEQAAFEQRLHELHRHMKEHLEAGRAEEAAQVKREITELQQRARHPHPGERSEHVMIATQRLLEAAEHLRAAGMPDPAENLTRMAHEIRERQDEKQVGNVRRKGIESHDGPIIAGRPDGEREPHREGLDDRLHDLTLLVKKLHERLDRLERTDPKNRDRD